MKTLMKIATLLSVPCLLMIATALPAAPAEDCSKCTNATPGNATDAWRLLDEGNKRFVSGGRRSGKEALDICRRECTVASQRPFAVVLACSDSRVPVEMLFDQRVGDVFVVRVAGNVGSDEAVGSIEYAIDHFKDDRGQQTVKLLLVMGHQKCGAVEAAWKKSPTPDLIPSILNRIFPAVKDAPDWDSAIRQNVDLTVKLLPTYSPVISKFAKSAAPNQPNIRGIYYCLTSGSITGPCRQDPE